jgi:alpha-D-ribose 1-methylphosphonate 5-triphosphate synthase subunit PhnH
MTELGVNPAFAGQAAFRAAMEAFARPGEVRRLATADAPALLAPATAALVQSLADYDTPVWLDTPLAAVPAIADWIRFRTGAPIAGKPDHAAFALIGDPAALPAFELFAQGSDEYPDRSTTLIVQVARFAGPAFTVEGPGIKTARSLAAEPLPADFPERLSANRELFPRGVDVVLVAGDQAIALPRSIRVSRRP